MNTILEMGPHSTNFVYIYTVQDYYKLHISHVFMGKTRNQNYQKSCEQNHKVSAVCILITKLAAKFSMKLDNSHFGVQFFLWSFGWL